MRTYLRVLAVTVAVTLAACGSHKGIGGASCSSKGDCDSGLFCVGTTTKVCGTCPSGDTNNCAVTASDSSAGGGSSSGHGSSSGESAAPVVSVDPSTSSSYLDLPVVVTATASAGATITWAVTTQPSGAVVTLGTSTSVSFTPSISGTYGITATATKAGLSSAATATLTIVADTLPTFISTAAAINGHASGIFALATDAATATFLLPQSMSDYDALGVVALSGGRAANVTYGGADYALNVSSVQGPLSVTGTPGYHANSTTCQVGHTTSAGECYRPFFNLRTDPSGRYIAFLAAEAQGGPVTSVNSKQGGAVYFTDTSAPAPLATLLAADTEPTQEPERVYSDAAIASDALTAVTSVTVVGAFGCQIGCAEFDTITNLTTTPVITQGTTLDYYAEYDHPTLLSDKGLLFVRRAATGTNTTTTDTSLRLQLVRAAHTTPPDYTQKNNWTTLFAQGPFASYAERTLGAEQSDNGQAQCTAAVAAHKLGLSETSSLDYALNVDGTKAVLWMNAALYSDCSFATNKQARALAVVDLLSGTVVPVATEPAGVAASDAAGAAPSCTIKRAAFVSGDQQIAFSCSHIYVSLVPAPPATDLFVVNIDGSGGHSITANGASVGSVTTKVVDFQ